MKLHLPKQLFCALLTAITLAAPAAVTLGSAAWGYSEGVSDDATSANGDLLWSYTNGGTGGSSAATGAFVGAADGAGMANSDATRVSAMGLTAGGDGFTVSFDVLDFKGGNWRNLLTLYTNGGSGDGAGSLQVQKNANNELMIYANSLGGATTQGSDLNLGSVDSWKGSTMTLTYAATETAGTYLLTIYKNGTSVGTLTSEGVTAPALTGYKFGAATSGRESTYAMYDNVGIWNSAMTSAEVSELVTAAYEATLAEGTTNATSATWTGKGTSWESVSADQKAYLRLAGAANGSTLNVGTGGATVQRIDATTNAVTVQSDGTVTVNQLWAGSGASLTLDATVASAEALTVGGDGSVSLQKGGSVKGLALYGALTLADQTTLTVDSGAASMMGGASISGGELVLQDGVALTIYADTMADKSLNADFRIQNGGTMQFVGSSADKLNYDAAHTIYLSGTGRLDMGTTRMTAGLWTFDMTGGTIDGAGQNDNSYALDFHENGKILAHAANGASAEAPTVSTVNATIRNRSSKSLTVGVDENAALRLTGTLTQNGTLVKTGTGLAELSGAVIGDGNLDVQAGTLELRGTAAISGASSNAGTLEVSAGETTISGTLNNTGTLKVSGGTVVFSDAVTTEGDVAVTGGEVNFGSTLALGDGTSLVVSGGAVTLGGRVSITGTGASMTQSGSGALYISNTIDASSGSVTLGGSLNIAGQLYDFDNKSEGSYVWVKDAADTSATNSDNEGFRFRTGAEYWLVKGSGSSLTEGTSLKSADNAETYTLATTTEADAEKGIYIKTADFLDMSAYHITTSTVDVGTDLQALADRFVLTGGALNITGGEVRTSTIDYTAGGISAASGGTLVIDVAETGGHLARVTGAGNVKVVADTTLNSLSASTGSLTVGNGGDRLCTLSIGDGTTSASGISSFTSVTLDKGKLYIHSKPFDIQNLTVSGNGGEIYVKDTESRESVYNLTGTTTLNGDLTIDSEFKYNINIAHLQGDADLIIKGKSNNQWGDPSKVEISSLQGYTGAISFTRVSTVAAALSTLNLTAGGSATLAGLTLAGNATAGGVVGTLNIAGDSGLGALSLTNSSSLAISGSGLVSVDSLANSGTISVGSGVTLDLTAVDGNVRIGDNNLDEFTTLVSGITTEAGAFVRLGFNHTTSSELKLKSDLNLGLNIEAAGALVVHGRGSDYALIVGEGKTLKALSRTGTDGLQGLEAINHGIIRISGGAVEASNLVLGHTQAGTYWGKLEMSSGSLKTGTISLRRNHANVFSVTGGELEFTSADVLACNTNTASTISIGGTAEAPVILKATQTAWTLDGSGLTAAPTVGFVTIDSGNKHAVTLKNVSLNGSITNNAALTLDNIGMATGTNFSLAGSGTTTLKNTSLSLGQSAAVSGSGLLVVDSGSTLTMNVNNQSSSVQADVKVQSGGVLNLAQSDALGWGDSRTKSITLLGGGAEDAQLAKLTATGIQTMETNLVLQGNSLVSGGGFEFLGGSITATGTNNTFAANINTRNEGTITVTNEGDELSFSGNFATRQATNAKVTKSGAGKLVLTGASSVLSGAFEVAAGEVELRDGSTSFSQAVTNNADFNVSGGSATFSQAVMNNADFSVSGGSATFSQAVTNNADFSVSGGTVDFDNGLTMGGGAGLSVSGGNVTVGALTVTGTGVQVSQSGTGSLILSTGATVNENAGLTLSGAFTLEDTIANNGSVTFGAGSAITVNHLSNFEVRKQGTSTYLVNDADTTATNDSDGFVYMSAEEYWLVKGGDVTLNGITTMNDGAYTLSETTEIDEQQGVYFDSGSYVQYDKYYITSSSFTATVDAALQAKAGAFVVQGGTMSITEGNVGNSRIEYTSGSIVLNGAEAALVLDSANQVNALLQGVTGSTGTVELKTTATVNHEEAARFGGILKISEGGVLQLGSDNFSSGGTSAWTPDVSSFSHIELAGGMIKFRGGNANLGDIEVTSASELHLYDASTYDVGGSSNTLVTLDSLDLGANLNLSTHWKSNVLISNLKGSNAGAVMTVGDCSDNRRMVTANVAYDFAGKINVTGGDSVLSNLHFKNTDGTADVVTLTGLKTTGAGHNNNYMQVTHSGEEKTVYINRQRYATDDGENGLDATLLSEVTLNGATLDFYGGSNQIVTTIDKLAVNGESTVRVRHHEGDVVITGLTGTAATLNLESKTPTSRNTRFSLNDSDAVAHSFSGTINVYTTTDDGSRKTVFNLNSAQGASNAVITLADRSTGSDTVALAIGAETVTIAGLKDGENHTDNGSLVVVSGTQGIGVYSFASDDTVRTLKIATQGGTYSSSATLKSKLSLQKEGAGSQTFSGATGDFDGTITVNGGTLGFTGTGDLGSGAITVAENATLELGNSSTTAERSIANAISGAGKLSILSGGTVKLSTAATHSGGTTVQSGATLSLASGGQTGALRGTVDVYGTLNCSTGDVTGWGNSADVISNLNVHSGGLVHVAVTNNQTAAGLAINLQGGSLTGVSGSNLDLFYGGGNKYASINALAAEGATAENPTVSSISGVRLGLRQKDNVFDVAENARLDISSALVDRTSEGTGSSPAGTVTVTKTGVGELRLTGANSYSQHTFVNAGTLTLAGSGSLASDLITIADGATFDIATTSATTTLDAVTGAGRLLHSGSSATTLASLTGFSGDIEVKDGATLNVGTLAATHTIDITNAGTLNIETVTVDMNLHQLSSTGESAQDYFSHAQENPTASADGNGFRVQVADYVLFNGYQWEGPVSDSLSIVVDAENNRTLISVNSVGSQFVVNNSATYSDTGALGTDGILIAAGQTLDLAPAEDAAYAYVIEGDGALQKSGGATLTLSGSNSHAGGTAVSAGTLKVTTAAALGSGPVSVAENAEFVYAGSGDETLGADLSGAGTVTLGTTGVLSLGPANEGLTGDIIVSSGTLKVAGGQSSNALGLYYIDDKARKIEMKAGTTLDVAGSESYYHVVLGEGATITNSGNDILTDWRALPCVELAGNAFIDVDNQMVLQKGTNDTGGTFKLVLNDHTLTKTGEDNLHLINVGIGAGLVQVNEGVFQLGSGVTLDFGVDFKVSGGTLKSSVSASAADITFDGGSVQVESNNTLTATGTTTIKSTGGTLSGNLVATDSVTAEKGGALQLGTTGNLKVQSAADTNQHVTISGTAESASVAATSENSLIRLQEDASFTIQDMTLTNTTITAATYATPVRLQNVTASAVLLDKGSFTTVGVVPTTVGMGGSDASFTATSSLLSGITLNSAVAEGGAYSATMTVDLGDLSSAGIAMGPGRYDFTITLSGFSMGDYSGLATGGPLVFASDSWLGNLLSKAENADVQMVITSTETAAAAAAESGAATGVTFSSGSVGTVITITGLNVPEPATCTLSLLALASLAARRRRK